MLQMTGHIYSNPPFSGHDSGGSTVEKKFHWCS